MFPEVWAVDMTFGLNLERRQLVTICGVDGNCNSYTGLRVWMPSKQRVAYQWTVDTALPVLIGETTTLRNQMIASDDEAALVDAIKLAVDSPDGSLRNSKFRKDYFHLVSKKWIAILALTKIKDTSDSAYVADTIGSWIKSWFSYVNNDKEFEVSYKQLQTYMMKYLSANEKVFYEAVKDLINTVIASKKDVGRQYFRHRITLGYIGSSIVEGANPGIKNGDFGTKSTMRLDTSTQQQLKQVTERSKKKNIQMAREMNSNIIWSRSGTKQILTKYMESIVVKNFDGRLNYDVCYNGNFTWYVMNKAIMEYHNNSQSSQHNNHKYCRFVRVYQINADADGFMLCSCGYIHEYMVPCVHLMAVLNDSKFIVPSLFHVRWWKHFNYYFGKDIGTEDNTEMHSKLQKLYQLTYDEQYYVNGTYRGCFVSRLGFLEQDFSVQTVISCPIMNVMKAILIYNGDNGPILNYTTPYKKYMITTLSTTIHEEIENNVNENEEFAIHEDEIMIGNDIETLGEGVTAACFLSQDSLQMESMIASHPTNENRMMQKGDSLYNYTMQVMDSIRTKKQHQRFEEFLHDFHAEILAENNPQYSDPKKRKGTVMLFADESSRADSTKRHREWYEQKRK